MEASEGCLEFQAQLPGYLEGDGGAGVPSHAAECEFCRCLLEDLGGIRKASGELAEEEPPAAVWTSIRTTLVAEGIIRAPEAARSRWRIFTGRRPGRFGLVGYPVPLAAAAAVALIAVALFKTPGYLVRSPLPRATVYTLHAAAFMQGSAAPEDTSSLRQTASQMEQAYHASLPSIDPSVRATYEKSLNSLNDEIRECQASMQQQPENRLTQDYLSNAYAEKIQLLQTALEPNGQ